MIWVRRPFIISTWLNVTSHKAPQTRPVSRIFLQTSSGIIAQILNTLKGNNRKMNESRSHLPLFVLLLILLQFFLGVGALAGGATLMLAPDGSLMHMPLSMLAHSPFPNFLIPGALLFTFVGLYPLAVAYSLWKRPAWRWPNVINPFKQVHWSWAGSLAAGVAVIVWILAEVAFLGTATFIHYFYLAWGIAILLVSLLASVRHFFKVAA